MKTSERKKVFLSHSLVLVTSCWRVFFVLRRFSACLSRVLSSSCRAFLELHQVGLVALSEREGGSEVLSHELHALDVLQQGGVHGLLDGPSVLGEGLGGHVLLLLGGELLLLGLLLLLGSLEEAVGDAGHVHAVHGDGGGGGDHVALGHSSEGHSVDGEGAWKRKKEESERNE